VDALLLKFPDRLDEVSQGSAPASLTGSWVTTSTTT
jgi:hypothetical protein